MKVCGFTIVRNAIKLDYPVVEAIKSILPLCDVVHVLVGKSEDDTLGLVRSIGSDKIRIAESIWDDSQREGGRTLALETDKAFAMIPADCDWCVYIQADEVIHEQDHPAIIQAMQQNLSNKRVEGLLFQYRHFYGSYDYVGSSWNWYRREIRIIRNNKDIFSYRDAQGFRKKPNNKLKVKLIDAWVNHYGWVRDPRAMQRKQHDMNRLYHSDQWIQEHVAKAEAFDYSQIDSLERFTGTHPEVMVERIKNMNWQFDHDLSKNKLSPRERAKRILSFLMGRRIGEYKNYIIL
ncbi:MAG TPA: glycosyltransferase family 2 protein [Cyclobacteriaceae bacterium]|nr:glycosyltransferase family 2 protein [Cyclobacteriaceae bacterium]